MCGEVVMLRESVVERIVYSVFVAVDVAACFW